LCETCGNLNYSQPAFKGRNVTIIYKPFKFSDTHTPTIFYSNVVTPWIAVPSTVMYNSTLGVFTTVFDTNLQNSGYLYAKYDLSEGCGYIYLRTPNPALGKRVEIGYYPSPAVIGLTGEYSREWYNESSSSSMTLTEGLLTEEELPNKEFVLTIYSATRWTTGSYSVKCTESTTNRLSTERVYVKVTVPPGQPFLQSPNIVQECPECLVGILYENFYHHVFCNTSGGTTPSINVGDEGGKVYSDTQFENIYKLSRTIGEKDHMKTVTCSVSNAALEKPLTTSANLFVALKPEVLVLNVPILREGSPANITCISRGGRPATNLSIWLDGANYSEDIVKTYDNSTRTYTTILTFNTPARKEWKSVSCESSSSLFGKTATQQKTINCEYPPTMLTMDAPTITSYSQDSYTLKFSCFTDTYNDHCLLSWTKDGQLHYANTYETEKIQDSALMEFAIVNKPSAHLSVKDEVLLNADDSTSVTCTATSFPLSDIVWTVNGDTQLLVCNKSEKCVMKTIPIETKEHRNYTCTAYFEFGNYNTSAISSFLAIGRASKQKPYEIPNESENASLTNSNGIPIVWIVIGLGVIFAAVILSTVIVLVRKPDMQENETVEMNEDVTYAQVNKIRTKRTEAVGLQTKGSDTNLVYADIDIEHLETASKPPSRQRPPSPTEYADVDFIRTERGSNSDNIIT
ncbi:NPHN-like protein, partial [Mya arenaria]